MKISYLYPRFRAFFFVFTFFYFALFLRADDTPLEEAGSLLFSKSPVTYPQITVDQAFMLGDKLVALSRKENLLFVWSDDNKEWEQHKLSGYYPLGDVTLYNNKMFLAGTLNSEGLSEELVSISIVDGSVEETSLAKLPENVFMPSLSTLGETIYVSGGIIDREGGIVSKKLHSLDPSSEELSWKRLQDFPQKPSIASTSVGQFGQIAFFGGMRLGSSGNWDTHSEVWVYLPKPVDGTTAKGWRQYEDMPKPIAGANALATGQAHAISVGGWQNSLTPTHLFNQDFVHNNRDLIISHLITFKHIYSQDPNTSGSLAITYAKDSNLLFPATPSPVLNWETKESSKGLTTLDYAVILLHFLVMAWMGYYFSKKQDNSEEFALGGRKVHWTAGAISMFATGASSISFMAIPAIVFSSSLVWIGGAIMLIPTFFLQTYFIYPLIRSLNLTSTYEYVHMRFHISIRYLTSAQLIISHAVGRISVVMLLPSLAISATTGLDLQVSVILMGVITTVYTAIGGFEAVVWSDLVQGILMVVATFLIIILSIFSLDGGFTEFVAVNESFDKFKMVIWDLDFALPVIWISLIYTVLTELAAGSDQTTVQRVLATPKKDIVKLSIFCTGFTIFAAIATHFSGLSVFSFFHANPEKLNPTMQNDQIIPLYIVENIPAGVSGLIVAALFAASMSTLSSSINSISILASKDFYERLRPGVTDKQKLFFMKVTSILVGALGTAIASYMGSMNITSLWAAFSQIMAFAGGGVASIYILGMFTERANTGGIICGVLLSMIALSLSKMFTDYHWTLYPAIAMGSSLLGGYFCSFFFNGNGNDLTGLTVYRMNRNKDTD